jgi:hypothetical protein
MAKRFFSTEIWEEDWFLEMPTEYQLFWFYICLKCDHAGLFKVNMKKFNMINRSKVLPFTALKYFNTGKERIRIVSESLWLIEDFFVFQYGETMNLNSKVHESVERIYNQANIQLTSIRGLKDLKDRVKDKDKDKEKKGGMGENKKQKGEKFNAEFTEVVFPDGKIQKLGDQQKELAEDGRLKPQAIIQGAIY